MEYKYANYIIFCIYNILSITYRLRVRTQVFHICNESSNLSKIIIIFLYKIYNFNYNYMQNIKIYYASYV